MTALAKPADRSRMKVAVALTIVSGLALIVAANAHLLYVAVTSQPDCVAHVRRSDGTSKDDGFSAATSSCTAAMAKPAHARTE
jgi:hypothetical protein